MVLVVSLFDFTPYVNVNMQKAQESKSPIPRLGDKNYHVSGHQFTMVGHYDPFTGQSVVETAHVNPQRLRLSAVSFLPLDVDLPVTQQASSM